MCGSKFWWKVIFYSGCIFLALVVIFILWVGVQLFIRDMRYVAGLL